MVDRIKLPTPSEILENLTTPRIDPVKKKGIDTNYEDIKLGQFAKEYIGHISDRYGQFMPKDKTELLLTRPFNVIQIPRSEFTRKLRRFGAQDIEGSNIGGMIFPSSTIMVWDWETFADYIPKADPDETLLKRRSRGFIGVNDMIAGLLVKFAAAPEGHVPTNHNAFFNLGCEFYKRKIQNELGLPYITNHAVEEDLAEFSAEVEKRGEEYIARDLFDSPYYR